MLLCQDKRENLRTFKKAMLFQISAIMLKKRSFTFTVLQGCAPSQHGGPGSILSHSLWDLWRPK